MTQEPSLFYIRPARLLRRDSAKDLVAPSLNASVAQPFDLSCGHRIDRNQTTFPAEPEELWETTTRNPLLLRLRMLFGLFLLRYAQRALF